MIDKNTAFRFIKPLLNIHIDDPSAYLLLMFLCEVANNNTGTSWHGYASITYTTGLSEKTIQRATKTLVQLGVVSCEVRGRQKTKLYTVHHHKLLELAEQGKAGRDKFILVQREQDAVRQQRRRGHQEAPVAVTVTATKEVETAPVAVKSMCCSGQIGVPVAVTVTRCSGHGDWGTTNVTTNRTIKELDAGASKISGSISGIQEKVSKLQALKNKVLSARDLPAYNLLTAQLQECQKELNFAHGALFKNAS